MDSTGSCGLAWYSRVPLSLPSARVGTVTPDRAESAGERPGDRLRPLPGDPGERPGDDADTRIAYVPEVTRHQAIA